MSMRELVNPQCGTQNPLGELSRQLRGREQLQQYGRQAYLSASGSRNATNAPTTFHMGELLQQINQSTAEPQQQPGASGGQQWASEFGQLTVIAPHVAEPWTAEFVASGRPTGHASSSLLNPATNVHPISRMGRPSMYGPEAPLFVPMERLLPAASAPMAQGAGSKWAEDILAESEQRRGDEIAELREVAKDFVRNETDSTVPKTDFVKFAEEVISVVNFIKLGEIEEELGAEAGSSTADRWANELEREEKSAPRSATRDDSKFWKDLAENWNNASFNALGENWPQGIETLPEAYRNYRFNEHNLLEDMVQNPFEDGLQKLREGDLPSAVLLFEAAVRKDSAHAEAWQLLGTTQAQNEQDVQAIAALRQCLQLQPQNGAAMLALAVSYTNEGLQRQACEVLTEWLRANPTYGHLTEVQPEETDSASQQAKIMSMLEAREHKRVLDMYIRAALINPDAPDPDIQSCLGVLLHLSGDFEKAVDCFRSAVAVRPDDSLLWNRLGASLANGGRSEEAVEAYRRSLELHPGFIRARFNLGITCISLGAHQQAAEHFLTALNIQDNAKAEAAAGVARSTAMSDNIWNTLRMTLTLMNRPDLYQDVDARDLGKLNRVFLKQEASTSS
ncbi:TPR repeat-containing protein-like [Tropilaelaps mercedesae]|uniref:TPR repeat-containing protein-like n=1 Tax=Tropilaelaps mercedesae TaxID=418985 RepID=A0A1V9Y2X3_9ACAR|nr:TPR repeat-containing protein-like [Tropilaelaps mercedesae]